MTVTWVRRAGSARALRARVPAFAGMTASVTNHESRCERYHRPAKKSELRQLHRVAFDAVLAQLFHQGRATQAEQRCGVGDDAAGLGERGADQVQFDVRDVAAQVDALRRERRGRRQRRRIRRLAKLPLVNERVTFVSAKVTKTIRS